MSCAYALKPHRSSAHCGDRCGVLEADDINVVYLIDGLGHGEMAERAALTAVEHLSTHRDRPLGELFRGCDRALAGSRGVAMGLARWVHGERNLSYFAVGNTRAAVVGLRERYLTGVNGVVGGGDVTPVPRQYPFAQHQSLAMWSDGLAEVLPFSRYRPEIRTASDGLAQRMLDDLAVEDDDASIVLYRK